MSEPTKDGMILDTLSVLREKIQKCKEEKSSLDALHSKGEVGTGELEKKKKEIDVEISEMENFVFENIYTSERVSNFISSLERLGFNKDAVIEMFEELLDTLESDEYDYALLVEITKKLDENAKLIASALKDWNPSNEEAKSDDAHCYMKVYFKNPKTHQETAMTKEKASTCFQRKVLSYVFSSTAEMFKIFGRDSFKISGIRFGHDDDDMWWVRLEKGKNANLIMQLFELGLEPLKETLGDFSLTFEKKQPR